MEYLVDFERQEKRYRVTSLLLEGDHYQVARVEDEAIEGKVLCAKTLLYDRDRLGDEKYVGMRRAAMREELEFLTIESRRLPEPIEWLFLEESETALGREPVLLMDLAQGPTLEEVVDRDGPLEPFRALGIFRSVLQFLNVCHESGWVFRCLHPSHVVLEGDDSIRIVGTGNATRRGQKPNGSRRPTNRGYLAPEIRDEVGGTTLQPPADLYSAGALLSYLLTGEHPREVLENPLTQVSFERLSAVKPEGVALLVARCMAPMGKNRMPTVAEMLPFTQPWSLPLPQTLGWGMLLLPAPWSGAESPETNRAVRSKISAGPLISVPQVPQDGAPQDGAPQVGVPKRRDRKRVPEAEERSKREEKRVVIATQEGGLKEPAPLEGPPNALEKKKGVLERILEADFEKRKHWSRLIKSIALVLTIVYLVYLLKYILV